MNARCWAILLAIKTWRQYLLGRQFIIRTDQHIIKYQLDQRLSTEAQGNWLYKLIDFSFSVEYKKGSDNSAADNLSHREESSSSSMGITIVPKWLERAKTMVTQGPYFQHIKKQLQEGKLSATRYKFLDGLWFYKGRVLVDATSEFCQHILHDFHSSLSGGHSGFHKTLKRLRTAFWWVGMKHTVKEFIRACETCQRNKHDNT